MNCQKQNKEDSLNTEYIPSQLPFSSRLLREEKGSWHECRCVTQLIVFLSYLNTTAVSYSVAVHQSSLPFFLKWIMW